MASAENRPLVGVIGGSGIYDIDGLVDTRWVEIGSPFGAPSDALLFGALDGQPLVFLPRHGRGHRLLPGARPSRSEPTAEIEITSVTPARFSASMLAR